MKWMRMRLELRYSRISYARRLDVLRFFLSFSSVSSGKTSQLRITHALKN